MLITDQYQDTGLTMSVACNMMMNLKWDEGMTMIGLVLKRSESLMNLK